MYKLREARSDDFHRIEKINDSKANIHVAAVETKMEKDGFQSALNQDDKKLYVVEKSGEIAAFSLVRIEPTARIVSIEKLSINHAYEKKGLDEHLYRKIERLAERSGITKLIVQLTTEHEGVHDFFSRKGWIEENNVYVLNRNKMDKE